MNHEIRKEMSLLGLFMVAISVVSSICIILGSGVEVLSALSWHTEHYGFVKFQDVYNYFDAIIRQSGTGYIIAAVAGCVLIRLVKGKNFSYRIIFKKAECLSFSEFLFYTALYLSIAFGASWIRSVFEQLVPYGRFDMAASPSLLNNDSMFFYAFLIGPISEEILFRGLVLRSLSDRNRGFAVIAAAVMAAFFQREPAMFLPAFLMGIVLGCMAIQYNICWSILLHVSGELIFRDIVYRIAGPEDASLVNACISLVCIFLVFVIGIWKHKTILRTIRTAFRAETAQIRTGKAWYLFLTSFGVIFYFIFMSVSILF